MTRFLCSAALLLFATLARPAQAEITNCTNITTLPAVIATQGVYCLRQDLATAITSGVAITIAANNITLDCNDWKIGGLLGGSTTEAVGISVTSKVNFTLRHCGVRGFYKGLSINGTGSAGHLVEDNRFDLNTYVGLYVSGDGDVVRNNRVFDTGGKPAFGASIAIQIEGNGAVVSGNIVNGVTVTGASNGSGSVYGFNSYGSGHEFRNNVVSSLAAVGTGTARGMYAQGFGSYRDNTIIGTEGQQGSALAGGSAASMCSGNRMHGFTTSLTNCTDAGGNVSN